VVLWPAERRVQLALAGIPEGVPDSIPRATIRDCRMVAASGVGLAVVFVAATVLMVARPH
jgi:hypothetical protein